MHEPGFSFGKEQRLSGRRAIDGVFRNGRGGFVYPLKYVFVKNGANSDTAVLISVPKKLHKRAVRRNLLKRRMREAFRLGKELQPAGVHLALLYATREITDYQTISHAVEQILEQVGSRI